MADTSPNPYAPPERHDLGEHGRELLAAWSESPDEFAMLEDARRRWGP